MNDYCVDCPDREACHQGMSCDLSRKFAFAANLYQQKMKGNKDMSSSAKKATVESVVAEAAEEKLVVPAQADGEQVVDEKTDQTDNPELTVIEGGKKSFKERVSALTEQVKKNKRAVIAVGAAAGVAALAFAKYAKKKAEEALVEAAANEETETVDGQTENPDESAA